MYHASIGWIQSTGIHTACALTCRPVYMDQDMGDVLVLVLALAFRSGAVISPSRSKGLLYFRLLDAGRHGCGQHVDSYLYTVWPAV